ncbi:hypothetical protein DCS_01446 [Drechmeria coniospora]|uniref:Up-regulated during septation protein 1 domain-containing protein n=1 Tax=Drechmeria coniospora TaxID=98403 RepID=A0A151GT66_DRECN|nr:hypothetical protein DCS_01446 [Drechmeria coniospora]KYK60309.1 hypothetical protein DCS_01446 [Drechmeria coniospora]
MQSTSSTSSSLDKIVGWGAQSDNGRNHHHVPEESDTTAAGLKVSTQDSIRRQVATITPDLDQLNDGCMDSPTIPGRPPAFERSRSAPEDVGSPTKHRIAAPSSGLHGADYDMANAINDVQSLVSPGPRSPQHLAPHDMQNRRTPSSMLRSKESMARIRSDSQPPMEGRSNRLEVSPMPRTRFSPSASTPDLTYARSTSAHSASTLPMTPGSASFEKAHRSPVPMDPAAMLQPGDAHYDPGHGHQRASESGRQGDRGRARRRTEVPTSNVGEAMGDPGSERKAFQELPKGWKPSDAVTRMSAVDVANLQRQACGQAERFEVLQMEDVHGLSKELRRLDERTEYLRRTYTSLRAGRRNLHSRICQYLRSPRAANFSHESMLKQEEALAELDTSIDEWVTKLEQAENRRTRVRQKLLEHVAAAILLPVGRGAPSAHDGSSQRQKATRAPSHHDVATPPRSPSKAYVTRADRGEQSPKRILSSVFKQLPPEPGAAEQRGSPAPRTTTLRRTDVESIRVYAGDDVYTLLADVEDEITQMTSHADDRRIEREVQLSHELDGREDSPLSSTHYTTALPNNYTTPPLDTPADNTWLANPPIPAAPVPTTQPREVSAQKQYLLSSAVFRP